jgi:hypothetical protein
MSEFAGIAIGGAIVSGEITYWIPRSEFPRILPRNYPNYPGPNGITRIGLYLGGK